ncbi:MAG: carboxypeptidase regulatory-like domain-containing protein [Planctomycetales bacterium]|nr:MAG: carboxypeptidase regulatory-like domain-containing protein [Planctomycetales bacterium]
MTNRIVLMAMLALIVLASTACGGSRQGIGNEAAVGSGKQPGLPPIASLDSMRGAAEIQQVELGTQFYIATSGNVANQNESVLFTSTQAEAAWALYSIDKADMEFLNLFVDFGTAAGQKLVVGIANYSSGRWEFMGPYTSSPANVSINTLSETGWISPKGKLYFLLLGQGNQTMIVNNIRLLADVPPVPTFPVSGTVLDENELPLDGVTITLSPGGGSLQTDTNGNYSFLAVPAGNWTITPTLNGWEFDPVSSTFDVVDAAVSGIDFTGTEIPIITHAVSGTVQDAGMAPISGVLMTLNPGGMTTSTDAQGEYIFPAVEVGGYTLTPSKTSFSFNPTNRNVNVSTADVTGQDFTGTEITSFSISGTVLDELAAPLSGVTLTLIPGGKQAITNGSGFFQINDVSPGPYDLSPELNGWSFDPTSRTVIVVSSNVTDQDFTGTEDAVVISFSEDLLPIIQGDFGSEYACIECHSGSEPEEGLNMTVYADVVDRSDKVVDRINRMEGSFGFMPKNGTKWLPAWRQMFQDWIDGGFAP